MLRHETASTLPPPAARTMTTPGGLPPALEDAAAIRAFVAGLPDDGRLPGEPKDPDRCAIFAHYARLADPVRVETMRLRYLGGISWEDAREALVALILRRRVQA